MKKWMFGFIPLILLLMVSCSPTPAEVPDEQELPAATQTSEPEQPPEQSTPTDSPTPIDAPIPEPRDHIIAIRQGANGAEFYNKESDETFTPIGANLIQFHPPEGDTTFTVGDYDHAWMDTQLTEMEALGFNTLRVFFDLCKDRCITLPLGGLRDEFIQNLTDFLWLAKDHSIFVILTSNDIPDVGTYDSRLPCCDTFGGYRGSYYLSAQGVSAWKIYMRDVVQALVAAGAPTEMVLAYQINNEQFFLSDIPPLSLTAGQVTTANGQSYDMASPEQKRQMAEDGLIFFADEVRAAILAADPTSLVTIGFFPPDEPHVGRGDNRLVLTSRFIQESSLDFYDLHPYDWGSLSLIQEAENFGILDGYNDKPLLMGEFGAFTYLYDSPEAGAAAVVRWQAASCQYGFDGWLYWLWGERDFNNEVWTGSQGNGAINIALSPLTRPDPCDPGDYALPTNLAVDAALRFSASLAENPPELAVDGLVATFWGAGAHPPQWIEFDWGAPAAITEVRLLVSQFPAGATRHRILGRDGAGTWTTLTEFNGSTQDGEWLDAVFEIPIDGIQAIRIETLASPSWVSWYEVVVIGELEN